ncbi:MAG: hypothetical protein ACOYL6_06935 [Bacteriovoracaceae bacterium]
MKNTILSLVLVLVSFNSWALGSKICTSTKGVQYQWNDRTGGPRPYPGMILSVEEIKVGENVLLRQVRRENCFDQFCNIQQPDLVNIDLEDNDFAFLEGTKKLLSSEGKPNSPSYRESFAIKTIFQNVAFWMLCDSYRALVP